VNRGTAEAHRPRARHAVLMFPGFPMMAFSSAVEPLRAANLLSGEKLYTWTGIGLTRDPIPASNGFLITPDHAVSDAPEADRVILCSGGDADRIESTAAVRWLRRNLRAGAQIGAIADASFYLARQGFLDGYRCTRHWTSQPAFQEAFPHIALERDLYIVDRDRFTSAGGIGCFDMMLDLITRGRATLADLAQLEHLARIVQRMSLCGLGQGAPNPIFSTLRYFRDEYMAHIVDKVCPAGVCTIEPVAEAVA